MNVNQTAFPKRVNLVRAGIQQIDRLFPVRVFVIVRSSGTDQNLVTIMTDVHDGSRLVTPS